jgi:hypothetical protein
LLCDHGKTYRSVSRAETRNTASGGLPLVLGDNGFEGIADNVPELVVLVFEQEDEAGGLGVEGGGDVFDELGDDFLDAVVGDWGGFGEGVDAAAVGDGVEEVHVGGHWCGGLLVVAGRCEGSGGTG